MKFKIRRSKIYNIKNKIYLQIRKPNMIKLFRTKKISYKHY
jgi:hypothetical protein